MVTNHDGCFYSPLNNGCRLMAYAKCVLVFLALKFRFLKWADQHGLFHVPQRIVELERAVPLCGTEECGKYR